MGNDEGGYLVITEPWPGMTRGIYGDEERYVRQYWGKWGAGVYVTGDGANLTINVTSVNTGITITLPANAKSFP